ncbi:MAG: response regulator, partial [Chloroflexi bacterium]|nr:response regulator [Chloroflexota bacterium]
SRTALRQALLGILLSAMDWGQGCQVALAALARQEFIDLECLVQHPQGGQPGPPTDDNGDDRLQVSSRFIQMAGGTMRLHADAARLQISLSLPIGQRLKVLVVDDNPDTLSLFRRYLAGGAYEMIEAASGAEALQIARSASLDAIVLDVMMPSLDGWETLQALKNHPATRDVPVVVCSVLKERELALTLGAVDCLSKPVSQAELVGALGRHCGQPGPSRSARP